MMPMYADENCYPLFEQGPCQESEWYVLSDDDVILHVLPKRFQAQIKNTERLKKIE